MSIATLNPAIHHHFPRQSRIMQPYIQIHRHHILIRCITIKDHDDIPVSMDNSGLIPQYLHFSNNNYDNNNYYDITDTNNHNNDKTYSINNDNTNHSNSNSDTVTKHTHTPTQQ